MPMGLDVDTVTRREAFIWRPIEAMTIGGVQDGNLVL